MNKAARQRQRALEYLRRIKSQPCHDCGNSYPYYVMHFDHARGEKRWNISARRNAAVSTLMEELAKCDVVCANCHAIRTFNRGTQAAGPVKIAADKRPVTSQESPRSGHLSVVTQKHANEKGR